MSYRLPTVDIVLPYSFEDIKFPVNRIADNITFNEKIQLIDTNFDKLLEYCNVVENKGPYNYDYIYYLNGSDLNFINSSNSGTLASHPDNGFQFIEIIEKYNSEKVVICASSDRIDFYEGDVDTPLPLNNFLSYTQIKDKGSLQFKNISYIKYYNEKLYVYDSVLGTVFVYDLLPILTNDVSISEIKYLKQFFKIQDNIVAFDFNSSCIYGLTLSGKIIRFNDDFNVKVEYNIDVGAIDIIVNDENIFLLYGETGVRKYDLSLSEYVIYELENLQKDSFLSFEFSKKYDDIFYVLSDKYVYKYLITGEFVGYFDIDTMENKSFRDFSILEQAEDDYIFALDENKIHFFKDRLITFKLYDEVNVVNNRENISNLKIQNLELEQDFVYNAVLQKTLFNTALLYNSLLFKAYVETDINGVLIYKYLENLVNPETLNTSFIFYGQNEVFSFQTFNRAFREIYSIQEKIIELIKFGVVENTTNTLIL
jgi:hypothetical protein